MPSVNFQSRFAPDVESGKKTQTIRAHRKRPILAGDTLYLFTGMRHKGCRRLGVGTVTRVRHIDIGVGMFGDEIEISGLRLAACEQEKLAHDDGFKDAREMLTWFRKTHGLPFHGDLVEWTLQGNPLAERVSQRLCSHCHGTGTLVCYDCFGTGVDLDDGEECEVCDGNGVVDCPNCVPEENDQ